jgi:hypothetical protein
LDPGEDWNGGGCLQSDWLAEPHHGSQQVLVTPPFHREAATPTTSHRQCHS